MSSWPLPDPRERSQKKPELVAVPARHSGGSARAVLFGLAIAMLCVNIFVAVQFGSYVAKLNSLRAEFEAYKKQTGDQMHRMGAQNVSATRNASKTLASLQNELDQARKQLESTTGEVKEEALRRVDAITTRLLQERQRQAQTEQTLRSELAKVKAETHSRIGEVAEEVGTVKSQIQAGRLELDRNLAALRRVNGELGVQSGLIATNRKELDTLKTAGEKNYFEFNLARSKQATKVADVLLLLKKTDVKKNQFTIEVISGDKRTEKRDRTINEPLQFYVSKVKGPYERVEDEMYELVVNEVKKDRIVGYLATPKTR